MGKLVLIYVGCLLDRHNSFKMGAHGEKQSSKNNGRKVGSIHQGPRAGEAVRDSHLEDIGSTHSQLLLDHTGCGSNGAGRVMLHHLGELC